VCVCVCVCVYIHRDELIYVGMFLSVISRNIWLIGGVALHTTCWDI